MTLILFVLCLLVGLMLLSLSGVLWLTTISGSVMLSLLIMGAVYILIAAIIYAISLHRIVQQWRRRLNTIYEVSATFETLSYRIGCIVKKVVDFIR